MPIFAPRVDGLTPWLAHWVGANADRVSFIAIGYKGRLSAVLDGEDTAAGLRTELLEALPEVKICETSPSAIPSPCEGRTRVYAPLGLLDNKPLWLPEGINRWVGSNKPAAPEAGFRTLVIPDITSGGGQASLSYGVQITIKETATAGGPRSNAFTSLTRLLKTMEVLNCWVAYPGEESQVDSVTF